jgi:hypothetical protein
LEGQEVEYVQGIVSDFTEPVRDDRTAEGVLIEHISRRSFWPPSIDGPAERTLLTVGPNVGAHTARTNPAHSPDRACRYCAEPNACLRLKTVTAAGETKGTLPHSSRDSPQFPPAPPFLLPSGPTQGPRKRGHNHQTHRRATGNRGTPDSTDRNHGRGRNRSQRGWEPSCAVRTTLRRCERAGSALAKSREPGSPSGPGSLVRPEVRLG